MAVATATVGQPHAGRIHKEFAISLWRKSPTPETRSSMANDLARGKPIELSWLSGRMHELGNELGVPELSPHILRFIAHCICTPTARSLRGKLGLSLRSATNDDGSRRGWRRPFRDDRYLRI